MADRPVRWGVSSTGHIAGVVTEDLQLLPDIEVVAVASRSTDRAADFARHHEIPRSYGSTAELVADDQVDVVYVASPHSEHPAVVRACLEAGKAVLCEKPLTVTAAEATDLFDLAERQGTFLMEAMWARTNPLIRRAVDLVADGAIGEVRHVQAALGFHSDADDDHRLLNPDLAGGAILDMGIYPVHMAHLFLGEPDRVMAVGTRHLRTGVDVESTAVLVHDQHGHDQHGPVTASVHTSLLGNPANRLEVVGTAGRIVTDGFLACQELRLERTDADPEVFTLDLPGHGYTFQAQDVLDSLAAGRTESALVPRSATVECLRTLEAWLAALPDAATEPTDTDEDS
ncbi:Gfo/Idh/MocA family protein [Propionibacteriaceae bacterium Y2011]